MRYSLHLFLMIPILNILPDLAIGPPHPRASSWNLYIMMTPSTDMLGIHFFGALGSHSILLWRDTSISFPTYFFLVSSDYNSSKDLWRLLFNPIILNIISSKEWELINSDTRNGMSDWWVSISSLSFYEYISPLVDHNVWEDHASVTL